MTDYSDKLLVVAICGVSGTGKSTLMENLLKEYPRVFYRMKQLTTRPKREEEEYDREYWYVNDTQYGFIKSLLFLRTDWNGNRYGTIPDWDKAKDGRIGIAIANTMALVDLENYKKSHPEVQPLVIGLNKEISDIEAKRDGRDQKVMEKERECLYFADYIENLSGTNQYADTELIYKRIMRMYDL